MNDNASKHRLKNYKKNQMKRKQRSLQSRRTRKRKSRKFKKNVLILRWQTEMKSSIPVSKLVETEREKLLNLSDILHERRRAR